MQLAPRTSAGPEYPAPATADPISPNSAGPDFVSRRRGRGRAVLALVVGVVALFLVACGSDDDGSAEPAPDVPAAGQEAASAALEADRTVIDVRTPEEYAAGHVEGATLIDVQGADFNALIAELDPEGDYVVYCRSGNRSAVAATTMTGTGLDVWDGGGLTDMEAAGWPTSTE